MLTHVTEPVGSTQPRVGLPCPFLSAIYGPYLNSSHHSIKWDTSHPGVGVWSHSRHAAAGSSGRVQCGGLLTVLSSAASCLIPYFQPESTRGQAGVKEGPSCPVRLQPYHPLLRLNQSLRGGGHYHSPERRDGSQKWIRKTQSSRPFPQQDMNVTQLTPMCGPEFAQAQGMRCNPTTFFHSGDALVATTWIVIKAGVCYAVASTLGCA